MSFETDVVSPAPLSTPFTEALEEKVSEGNATHVLANEEPKQDSPTWKARFASLGTKAAWIGDYASAI